MRRIPKPGEVWRVRIGGGDEIKRALVLEAMDYFTDFGDKATDYCVIDLQRPVWDRHTWIDGSWFKCLADPMTEEESVQYVALRLAEDEIVHVDGPF